MISIPSGGSALDRSAAHLGFDQLRAYAHGDVSTVDVAEIEQHLHHCTLCCQRLSELPESAMETLIRQSQVSRSVALATPWRLVPGYEILEPLGRGGMGTVWKARHTVLNRIVALKMLNADAHASSAVLARFRREAQAIARLSHTGIVQIFDVGEQNGQPYLAMEYVNGLNLDEWLSQQSVDNRLAAQIVAALAEAIHHAHEQGIIHRDLKPANVLVSAIDASLLKITDFGLAQSQTGPIVGATQTGSVIGTPAYMAPEQATGDVHRIGPQTDVYSLGAILYQLLTGIPPFLGDTALQTLDQVLRLDPVAPRSLRSSIAVDLETICLKCLAKDVRHRYATALELYQDLQRFLRHESIAARPLNSAQRMFRHFRRKPVLALSFVMLTAAITFGAIGVVWHNNRMRQQEERRTKTEDAARRQRDLALDSFRHGYDVVDMLVREAERQRRELGPTELAERQRRQAWQAALRFFDGVLQSSNNDDEDLRVAKAVSANYVGIVHLMLGNRSESLRMLESARSGLEDCRRISTRHVGQQELDFNKQVPFDVSYQLARCYQWLARYHLLSDAKKASQLYRASCEILRDRLDQDPNALRVREKLADGYASAASVAMVLENMHDMEVNGQAAIERYQELIELDPTDDHYRLQLSLAYRLVTYVCHQRGDEVHADQSVCAAEDAIRMLLVIVPDHMDALVELAELQRIHALNHRRAGRNSEALVELDEGLRIVDTIPARYQQRSHVEALRNSLLEDRESVRRQLAALREENAS